jgi:hypothetical protein
VFEGRISVDPERVMLVLMDSIGRRALSVEWNGREMKVDAAPWVPAQIRAANIMADVMLLYWPEAAVRAALTSSGGTVLTPPSRRVVTIDGREIMSAEFRSTPQRSWAEWVRYRNLGWGYELEIQSQELTP